MRELYRDLVGKDVITFTSDKNYIPFAKILVNSIQKTVSKEIKDKPWHVEGSENAEWVLMDYVNIVVHVFQKHIREYYNIESLWGDAKITSIQNKF